MCGITGIAVFGKHPAPTYDRLHRMCDSLVHRGPDEIGMDIRDGVAFGMRRLSIIDLSGGSQPIFNEDASVRTVFNGEIYNYRELRDSLRQNGHIFATDSDTEVIVHAYEEYGSRFPQYLNGMFAFALHDSINRKLLLVRDHVGIKPLYYSFTSERLVWGSEIKAILAAGQMERQLDLEALGEFMAWEYVPGPRTLFKNIRKLEPGHMIEFALDKPACRPEAFWDIPAESTDSSKKAADWEDEVHYQIKKSVQRQLVSDVPLGAFLSGGVDSSLVVSHMGRAKTFSIGFDDPSYNELDWARKVADHLGVEHVDEIIRPDVAALFDQLMTFMDDPIADFSIFPTFLVSRHARKHVTVVLSGDGGDELFGGYETYLADLLAQNYSRLPKALRHGVIEPFVRSFKPRTAKKGPINMALRFVEGLNQDQSLSHARWRLFAGEALRRELFTPYALAHIGNPPGHHIDDLFKRAGQRDAINRSLFVDLKSYLCDNCLVKVDRMSMAVSLEARVPFLDTEMVELAFRIPGRFKLRNGQTKVLLKKVAARRVPHDCVYRRKEGFSIPMKNWLNTRFKALMDRLLDDRRIQQGGIFQSQSVNRLKSEHIQGVANHSHILWSLVVFEAWRERWLESTQEIISLPTGRNPRPRQPAGNAHGIRDQGC
jgi:asparagine synthase (glutamine-hydrolysing)